MCGGEGGDVGGKSKRGRGFYVLVKNLMPISTNGHRE